MIYSNTWQPMNDGERKNAERAQKKYFFLKGWNEIHKGMIDGLMPGAGKLADAARPKDILSKYQDRDYNWKKTAQTGGNATGFKFGAGLYKALSGDYPGAIKDFVAGGQGAALLGKTLNSGDEKMDRNEYRGIANAFDAISASGSSAKIAGVDLGMFSSITNAFNKKNKQEQTWQPMNLNMTQPGNVETVNPNPSASEMGMGPLGGIQQNPDMHYNLGFGGGMKFKTGGEIKGPGTGTSDSISGKMDGFIVPAKYAHIGKQIGEKYLGWKNGQRADVKSGTTHVKVSDGEVHFTPEEESKLRSMGFNLEALAPEADTSQHISKHKTGYNGDDILNTIGFATKSNSNTPAVTQTTPVASTSTAVTPPLFSTTGQGYKTNIGYVTQPSWDNANAENSGIWKKTLNGVRTGIGSLANDAGLIYDISTAIENMRKAGDTRPPIIPKQFIAPPLLDNPNMDTSAQSNAITLASNSAKDNLKRKGILESAGMLHANEVQARIGLATQLNQYRRGVENRNNAVLNDFNQKVSNADYEQKMKQMQLNSQIQEKRDATIGNSQSIISGGLWKKSNRMYDLKKMEQARAVNSAPEKVYSFIKSKGYTGGDQYLYNKYAEFNYDDDKFLRWADAEYNKNGLNGFNPNK